jgi:DNA-binding response OmpR family regulator
MDTRLLIIDDDVSLCGVTQVILTKRGFQVEIADDAISGLQKAYVYHPDLILLDVMLPSMNGWELLGRFREMSEVPIIVLTALNSAEDVIRGMDLGADAYLTKPVTGEELVARVQAVLRRASHSGSAKSGVTTAVCYEGLAIDFEGHEVTLDGERVDLTPKEFSLLSVLAQNHGRVLTSDYLLRKVWGPEYICDMNYLRLYVRYLRRKLEKSPSKPHLICTVYGVGYRFG